jgi:hypothetical protein
MTAHQQQRLTSVEKLALRIRKLPPARQLELAVRFMDAGDVDMGINIAEAVVLTHQASKLGKP